MPNRENESEHWLSILRNFSNVILGEIRSKGEKLREINLSISDSIPLDKEVTSIWVDGGNANFDCVGGSWFIVKAAAGYFSSGEKIKWHEKTRTGFTTLPRNIDRFVGIHRDILEIECVLELIENEPDFIVLDNSLTTYANMGVPHSLLKFFESGEPMEESSEYDFFRSFVDFKKRFNALIQQCKILDIPLIGAAKDPKSRLLARKWNLGKNFIDSSAISMLAKGKTGFTEAMEAKYLRIPRVEKYLEKRSLLTGERGRFQSIFGILQPNGRVFRVDFPEFQKSKLQDIRKFLVAMHDGNGYLIPSHIVHNRATMPDRLSDGLSKLVMSSVAKEDMEIAKFLFSKQRRSKFG
ncbi:MAG: hypothetical protein BAJATHORv1_40337 [Candidatus Thorarchaeota archaeon]|nr:MAG: hypothetical protein BAJATHORv1_40337 [Candidatus Thorarchaeota archaeon]